MKKKQRIRVSSIIIAGALAALALGVFFVYALYLNSYFQRETEKRLFASVEQSRYDIEAAIDQAFTVLDTVALSLSVRRSIVDADSLDLLHEQYQLYEYGLMLIITPDGTGYASNGRMYELQDRDYFRQAMAGKRVITELQQNRQNGEPSIIMAVPIKHNERVLGVFTFGFPFAQLRNLLKNNTLASQSVSYILNTNRTLITKTDSTFDVAAIEKVIFSEQYTKNNLLDSDARKYGFYRTGDTAFFASYAPLSISDWFIVTVIPAEVYFSQWSQLLFTSGGAFLVFVLLQLTLLLTVIRMQRLSAEELRRSEERYRIVSEQANEVIFEWNLADDTLVLPEKVQKSYSILPEGSHFRDNWESGDFIYDDDRAVFIKLFKNAAEGTPANGEGVYRRKKSDGSYGWERTRLVTLFDSRRQPYKVVGVSFDVDDEMNRTLALRAKAERDSLTDLYNKGFTASMITGILSDSVADSNRHALFLIDIDNFKGINDTFGHLIGDEVLRTIGAKLKKTFRSQDVCGRIGGDEFAVFLRDVDSDAAIIERAEKLQEIFKASRTGRDKKYKVSGSIGIALYPRDGNTFAELSEKADQALYGAKKRGKDCYQIYGGSV